MEKIISELLLVASIHLLAVMSPGPDFVVVSNTSLTRGRKMGIISAIGVALGIGVHVLYSLIGISALVATSRGLYMTILVAGSLYLIYSGITLWRHKAVGFETTVRKSTRLSSRQIFIQGFVTNILNPKAALFFLAIFTQVIGVTTPLWLKVLYGIEMVLATAVWFSIVAWSFGGGRIQGFVYSRQEIINKVTGVLLVLLGVKILF